LGFVCVMSFFLLSGRIFLQSTGRFCCIKDFVVFFSVVFIFGFVFSSPLDLVFSSICLLSAALSRLSQALSSGACVCCLLSLVCLISGSSLVCQSHQGYLRSAGQSGCIEGCAASNSGRSLKFELSLAMRGKAVISTEKR